MASPSHFRELDVWRQAMEVAKQVYSLTAEFPAEHRYGLSSQLQRAAVSVPSNVAEGNARGTRRDYARFVGIARGSAAELQTQLILVQELGLGDCQAATALIDSVESINRMLYRLQQSLNSTTSGSGDNGPRSPVPGP